MQKYLMPYFMHTYVLQNCQTWPGMFLKLDLHRKSLEIWRIYSIFIIFWKKSQKNKIIDNQISKYWFYNLIYQPPLGCVMITNPSLVFIQTLVIVKNNSWTMTTSNCQRNLCNKTTYRNSCDAWKIKVLFVCSTYNIETWTICIVNKRMG